MLDLHWGKRGVQAHDSVCRIDVAVASRALCLVRLVLLSFLSSLGGWNKRESPPGASGAGTSVIPPAPVGVPPDPAKIIYNIVNGARALGHPFPLRVVQPADRGTALVLTSALCGLEIDSST